MQENFYLLWFESLNIKGTLQTKLTYQTNLKKMKGLMYKKLSFTTVEMVLFVITNLNLKAKFGHIM